MSIVDGQRVRALESNAAWASKSSNNTLAGVQTLSHGGSGASVANLQQTINDALLDVTNLQSLSGMPDGSVDLGVFAGSTIPDNQTAKQALQSLETSLETITTITTAGISNNVLVAADITGMVLLGASHTAARFLFEIRRQTDTKESVAVGHLSVFRRPRTGLWDFSVNDWSGFDDDTLTEPAGVTFSILQSGADVQVQYLSHDLTGASYVGQIKFSSRVFSI